MHPQAALVAGKLRPLTWSGQFPAVDKEDCVMLADGSGQVFVDDKGLAVSRAVRRAPVKVSFSKDGDRQAVIFQEWYTGPKGNLFFHPVEADPTNQTVHRAHSEDGTEFSTDGYIADGCHRSTGEEIKNSLRLARSNSAAEADRKIAMQPEVQQERMNDRMAVSIEKMALALAPRMGPPVTAAVTAPPGWKLVDGQWVADPVSAPPPVVSGEDAPAGQVPKKPRNGGG